MWSEGEPVVLPDSTLGGKGWWVYLLASTHEQGTVVQGGHHRYVISEDARTVLSADQLLRCSVERIGKETVAIGLSTPFYDFPNEGHVFTSLSNRLDFYLGTSRGMCEISGSGVRFFERVPETSPPR